MRGKMGKIGDALIREEREVNTAGKGGRQVKMSEKESLVSFKNVDKYLY